MRAAVKALRQRGAAKIVVAVPVGPPDLAVMRIAFGSMDEGEMP